MGRNKKNNNKKLIMRKLKHFQREKFIKNIKNFQKAFADTINPCKIAASKNSLKILFEFYPLNP
jgi:hypothetical protein